MNITITNHEQHSLMKVFDHNNDGQISMEEFYNTLAQEFWAPTTSEEVTLAHTSAALTWASINST